MGLFSQDQRHKHMRSLVVLSLIIVLVAALVAVDMQKDRFYVFDQDVLQDVARKAIASSNDTSAIFQSVADQLAHRYPGHVETNPEWVFNNAGGAMGAMWVLHSSITEYVIIFGTAVGTEGHTGRFFADDYFTILEGEQWSYSEGATEKEIFRPGDQHHLPRGHAKQYRMPDKCFALEYARGIIPLMLPFGVADFFFSTLDFVSLYRTFAIYGRHVIRELLLGKL